MHCSYCDKPGANAGANKKHENSCVLNPNRVVYKSALKGKSLGRPSWNKGTTKATDIRVAHSQETKKKLSKHKHKHTEETKKRLSETRLKMYAEGWESTCGRCKKYEYTSPIAGTIKVDGTWEIIFCKYADQEHLTWKRNKKRFPYIRDGGKTSTYQPDFFVEEWDAYVEVKGYETDLDRTKWSQFPYKLIILRKAEIQQMEGRTRGGSRLVC